MSAHASQDLFPNIERAALTIAYDQREIHRRRPEKALVALLRAYLATMPVPPHGVDATLGRLARDDFDAVCVGERAERMEILARFDNGLAVEALLHAIQDDVVAAEVSRTMRFRVDVAASQGVR